MASLEGNGGEARLISASGGNAELPRANFYDLFREPADRRGVRH